MSNFNNSDRIELMHTFIRIVESGSLTAAALQLGITQPTISRRLQSLEQGLGLKLILRTTHALKLTDDGERCYAQARQLMATWHALEDELTGAGSDPVGILRVRAPHAFGQDQLVAPLVTFMRRYPRLRIEWMLNDRTPDFVAENRTVRFRLAHRPILLWWLCCWLKCHALSLPRPRYSCSIRRSGRWNSWGICPGWR